MIVMGAGQMARVVASHLSWVDAFVVNDEFWTGPKPTLNDVPIIPVSWLEDAEACQYHALIRVPVVNAITSPERDGLAGKLLDAGFRFRPVIAPGAVVHRTARIGDGVFVNSGAVVDRGAEIDFCALVNRGATVGHDAVVRKYATVGPGAHLAGDVVVRAMATVGMGALVREGVTVEPLAVVGMGAVVLNDVPVGETWVGNPARKLR